MYAIRDPSAAVEAPGKSGVGAGRHDTLLSMGSVRLAGQARCVMVRFGARGRLLGCLCGTKSIEVFR